MKKSRPPASLAGREIIIEFIEIGTSVRVAAIDAATGEEVVIQASRTETRAEMERVVMAKLARKLGLDPNSKRPGTGPGRGIKV